MKNEKLGYPKVNIALLQKGVYFIAVNNNNRRSFIKINNMIKQNLDFSKNIYDGFYWHQFGFNQNPKNIVTTWDAVAFNNRPGDHNLVTITCDGFRLQNPNIINVETAIINSNKQKNIFQRAIILANGQVLDITAANIDDVSIFNSAHQIVNSSFDFNCVNNGGTKSIKLSAKEFLPPGNYFIHTNNTGENIILNYSK